MWYGGLYKIEPVYLPMHGELVLRAVQPGPPVYVQQSETFAMESASLFTSNDDVTFRGFHFRGGRGAVFLGAVSSAGATVFEDCSFEGFVADDQFGPPILDLFGSPVEFHNCVIKNNSAVVREHAGIVSFAPRICSGPEMSILITNSIFEGVLSCSPACFYLY